MNVCSNFMIVLKSATLFNKTHNLTDVDSEIYEFIVKHLPETLVRLHRETEGVSLTGLNQQEVPLQLRLHGSKTF